MNNSQLPRRELIKMVSIRFVAALLILFILFFLSAGTFSYWQAWLYLHVVFIPVLFVMMYLFKYDPALLERRMRMRENIAEQKTIIKLGYLYFFVAFLVPGFDHRFGWSQVPFALVIVSDVIVLLGYGIFFLVLRTNSYASRIIEVEQGQKVIDTGPYAVIRHPMYLGISLMYVFSPLALGSYWAVIPSILIIPLLLARIRNEESVLLRELDGYTEYILKTKYRLFPGIW